MTNTDTGLLLEVSDTSLQRAAKVRNVAPETTVGEIREALIAHLQMVQNDVEGRPLSYGVRRKKDGLALNAWEKVGDVLETGDAIWLEPSVDAA